MRFSPLERTVIRRACIRFGALFVLVACSREHATAPITTGTGQPPAATGVVLSIVAGNNQSAPVNTQLRQALRVRATDSAGNALANLVLNFVVTSGGGSVYASAIGTTSDGDADEVWTLGPRLGPQTIEVRTLASDGQPHVLGSVSATGLPPHNLRVVGSNSSGIYSMNADGTSLAQLTTGGTDFGPDFSSDYGRIVFWSKRIGPDSISVYMMNADGSHVRRISGPQESVYDFPHFSPDNYFVAFIGSPPLGSCPASVCGAQNVQVQLVDTTGLAFPSLSTGDGVASAVAWSPGNALLFSTNLFGAGVDLMVTPDSVGRVGFYRFFDRLTLLTRNWLVGAITVAPTGNQVYFIGGTNGSTNGPVGLYTIPLTGGNPVLVTSTLSVVGTPPTDLTISPDGTLIATSAGLMNSDGTNLVAINGGGAGHFAMAPSGTASFVGAAKKVRRQ
jgi:hypothetical protein